MKIAKVERGGRTCEAIIDGNSVHVVGDWVEGDPVETPFSIERMMNAPDPSGEVLNIKDVRLVSPSGPLTKLVCLGLNYRNHVAETHNDLPENPLLFLKIPDSLVGHDEPIVRPRLSTNFDYEGEIAVVIGRGGRHIAREEALNHVFGYTIMLDGSVRDYMKHSASAGKNFWKSGSMGPWIVTSDEIPDPKVLTLETRLNGVQVQQTTAELMLYDIPTVISYVSEWALLRPGDVIATGTPAGVGARRQPPLWMKQGDVIEIEISPIGVLRNNVIDES